MAGVFIQYDGGWRGACIMGNLYGRIKREGQASLRFGLYSKKHVWLGHGTGRNVICYAWL